MRYRVWALVAGILFAVLSASPAFAQWSINGTPVTPFVPLGCPSAGGNCAGTLGSAQSPVIVTVSPYGYTPLSPGQHNLAITSSTGLTIPSGATYAIVQGATANAKYTTDGTTTPTSSIGMTLYPGAAVALSGATVLANFRAISATGTLDVEFYK